MKLADLLTLSAERGASDMHLTAGLPPLIRVDGDIGPIFQTIADAPRGLVIVTGPTG